MGIMLTYDVTEENSFLNIRNWMKNIEEHAADNVNKMLIGNKCDLVEKKTVDTERGQQLAKSFGIPFMETSAKNNINVEEAFFTIAREIKTRLIDSGEVDAINDKGNEAATTSTTTTSNNGRKQSTIDDKPQSNRTVQKDNSSSGVVRLDEKKPTEKKKKNCCNN